MHHFTAYTSMATSEYPGHDYLWNVVIPKMGFQHSFLLHGILSVAALHKRKQVQELQQQAMLLEVARDHQQQALTEYIPLVGDITDENCHALFAFSQALAAISYTLLQLPAAQQSPRDFIQGIVAVFDLLIGTVVIAVEGRDWLRRGELASMMGHGPSMLDWNMMPLSDEPKIALASLLDRIQSLPTRNPGRSPESSVDVATAKDCYVEAVQKMKPLFPRMPETRPKISTVIGWAVFVDAKYIALLKQEDAAALVILAYYGVTLHKLDHVWWLSGLGARLVHAVSEIVSEEWAPYLIWPKSEVMTGSIGSATGI